MVCWEVLSNWLSKEEELLEPSPSGSKALQLHLTPPPSALHPYHLPFHPFSYSGHFQFPTISLLSLVFSLSFFPTPLFPS